MSKIQIKYERMFQRSIIVSNRSFNINWSVWLVSLSCRWMKWEKSETFWRESRKNTIYQLLLNGPKIASAWRGAVFNFLNTMGLNYFWFWFLKSKRYLSCTSQVFTRVNSEFISRSPHKNNQYESWIFEKKFCLFNFWENIYVYLLGKSLK